MVMAGLAGDEPAPVEPTHLLLALEQGKRAVDRGEADRRGRARVGPELFRRERVVARLDEVGEQPALARASGHGRSLLQTLLILTTVAMARRSCACAPIRLVRRILPALLAATARLASGPSPARAPSHLR